MKQLCAVIVETRPIPDLDKIIKQHMKFLPKGTDLIIFCGDQTKHLTKIFKKAYFYNVGEMSINKYNELLTTPAFWSIFDGYKKVLIFQSDSMILRKGIEAFYPYDFVGAELPFPPFCGNGGFSLRTPAVMKRICTEYQFVPAVYQNEDIYFCTIINRNPHLNLGKLAPVDICRKFSVESLFQLGAFGYHAIDKWLTVGECDAIRNQYV